jgi:hypothetical protein
MPAAETASRLTPYLQEALDNKEVQEQIRRGADRLRAAYGRSRKRRVKAAHDAKLRRRLLIFLTLGVVGGGVALALKNQTEGGSQ